MIVNGYLNVVSNYIIISVYILLYLNTDVVPVSEEMLVPVWGLAVSDLMMMRSPV